MDIVKVFGSNVKRYRQQTGLSQEAFAEKCGMHRTYTVSYTHLTLPTILLV